MDNNLNRVFDQVKPSPEQKEAMLNRLLEPERKVKPMKKLKKLAVFAGAAALMVVTCAAAVVTGIDQRFLEFLGAATAEQAEPLIAGAQVVNRTAEDSGSTLTVREVLGDKNNLYLLLNFTAPEGTVLDAYDYRFRKDTVTFDARSGWQSIGYTKLADDDPGDNSLDLVMHITTDGVSRAGTMTLRMGNLEAAAGYGEPYVALDIPGEWKLSFPLRCADSSLTREMQVPVTVYGQEATVTEVSLSPLAVTVKGNGGAMDDAMKSARASGAEDIFPVTLHFRDGTSLTTSWEAGDGHTILVERGRDFYTNWTLHQIIDPDQVDYLIYGDTVIPVAQGQA